MPNIQLGMEIRGSPERIWSVITDPLMAPKMLLDVISATPSKEGQVDVGSIWTLIAKIAGRKVKIVTEATEVIPNKKLVIKIVPGSIFKSFVSMFELEKTKRGALVTEKIEYSTSADHLEGLLTVMIVNRHTRRNILQGLSNLKELVELKEFEGSSDAGSGA